MNLMIKVVQCYKRYFDILSCLLAAFVVVGLCIALQLGHQPYFMFFEVFSANILFYAAHWQTYVSGTMKFGRYVGFEISEDYGIIFVPMDYI